MRQLNHFDRLVIHGTIHNWCWRIGCTTCGCMEFRNGMELIGQGIDPLADESSLTNGLLWQDGFEAHCARSTDLGIQALAANIDVYDETLKKPYWIGFLGLAMERLLTPVALLAARDYLQKRQLNNLSCIQELLPHVWTERFFRLLYKKPSPPGSDALLRAQKTCKAILKGEREPLGIGDLSLMHEALVAAD